MEPTSQLGLLTIMQGPKWQNRQGGSLWVPPRQGGVPVIEATGCYKSRTNSIKLHIITWYMLLPAGARLFVGGRLAFVVGTVTGTLGTVVC